MTVPATRHGLLGKLEPVRPNIGEFKSYFTEALPAPPPSAHYGYRVTLAGVPWQMDANGPDPSVTLPGVPPGWGGCGDCVVAGMAHSVTIANFWEGGVTNPVPSANTVVETYCQLLGCTPEALFTDPDDYDAGLDMANSHAAWHTSGLFGVKLGAYAPVDCTNVADIKTALYLCGGLNIGIQVPQSAEEQFPHEWTWVPGSPILGGHDVFLTGYTADYVALVTWGRLIQCTWEFLLNTIDEAWALVSAQAVKHGKGPTGLLVGKLEADLRQL
jgi:hypothetical protein